MANRVLRDDPSNGYIQTLFYSPVGGIYRLRPLANLSAWPSVEHSRLGLFDVNSDEPRLWNIPNQSPDNSGLCFWPLSIDLLDLIWREDPKPVLGRSLVLVLDVALAGSSISPSRRPRRPMDSIHAFYPPLRLSLCACYRCGNYLSHCRKCADTDRWQRDL